MNQPIAHATARRWPWAARAYAVAAALAFAASLACGVWLYVSLGSSGLLGSADLLGSSGLPGSPNLPAPVWRALLVDVLLFGLFAAHHSLLARSDAKIVLTRWLSPALERSTYVWVASLLFMLVTIAWQPLPGVAWHVDGWLAWPLRAIQLGGVLLTLRAAVAIDPRELAGLRQAWRYGTADGASASVMDEAPVTFTVRGAYGVVRHPIYLGWFMMVWSSPHMTWGRVAFAAISSAYLLVAIPWEERALEARHGDGYRRYRAQVRWRVLPGLY
jgi:protein-S-isoprenylcysteine O-methyltransferase Ste14